MLSLSQTCGYAILALACLDDADVDDGWVKARDIAARTGIPTPYLSKILHQLGDMGLLVAKRGTFGGYALTAPPHKLSLLEVAEAVEGESWQPQCLLGFADCSDTRACPTHAFWSGERARIEAVLAKTTLKDVAEFERGPRGRLRSRRRKPSVARRKGR